MAKKMKTFEELSSQELYELALQREQEEQERQREAARAKIETLKQKRRDVSAKLRQEIAAIDREIRKLGGRSRTGARSARAGGRGDMTGKTLQIIGKHGPVSTKDIRAQLEKDGIDTTNLAQCLAYLKRNGRIDSPERATYVLAK
jgi:hypothetical protein